jgi:hypothetical protein
MLGANVATVKLGTAGSRIVDTWAGDGVNIVATREPEMAGDRVGLVTIGVATFSLSGFFVDLVVTSDVAAATVFAAAAGLGGAAGDNLLAGVVVTFATLAVVFTVGTTTGVAALDLAWAVLVVVVDVAAVVVAVFVFAVIAIAGWMAGTASFLAALVEVVVLAAALVVEDAAATAGTTTLAAAAAVVGDVIVGGAVVDAAVGGAGAGVGEVEVVEIGVVEGGVEAFGELSPGGDPARGEAGGSKLPTIGSAKLLPKRA